MSAMAAVEKMAAAYDGAPVLDDVSFEIPPGTSVCVLGPNGGGKTTLFRVLLGELEPVAGRVELSGRPAYVAQTDRTRLDFPVTALDVALMGTLAAGAGGSRRGGPIATRRARRSSASGWPARRTSDSGSCPAASGSAPCSPARSSRTPPCCCSTNRCPGSIPPARR